MNQIVIGIDPGTTHSAIVALRGKEIIQHGRYPNDQALVILRDWSQINEPPTMAVENISGQRRLPGGRGFAAVGQETFETCVWIGRFTERYGEHRTHRLERSEVVRHVCGKIPRAKEGQKKVSRDTLVRQGIIDLYAKHCADPIGKSKEPGPLFKISADQWSALAIAITFRDTVKKKR